MGDRGEAMITIADEGKALSHSPLFEHFTQAELRQLAFASERVVFSDGDAIIRQGEDDGYAYLILDGEVEGWIHYEGEDRMLGTVETGFVFGDAAMLTGNPYAVTAKARGPVTALRMRRDSYLELVGDNKDAMGKLLNIIAAKKAEAEQMFDIKLG